MKIENEKWHVHPQYRFENVYWLFNQDDNYHEDTSAETMDKRARLMEAAPDLLDALKGLQKAIHDEHLLNIKKRASLCIADSVACSAIFKAERET